MNVYFPFEITPTLLINILTKNTLNGKNYKN